MKQPTLLLKIVELRKAETINTAVEQFLVVTLGGLSITTFFMRADKGWFNLFSLLSLFGLLVLRFRAEKKLLNPLPKPVVVSSLLFVISISMGTLISDDQYNALILFKHYRFIILGGLLYSAPLRDQYRKIIIVVLLLSAAATGVIGLLQYFKLIHLDTGSFRYMDAVRPTAYLSHPNFFAGVLAVLCSSAVVMFIIPRVYLFTSKVGSYFLAFIIMVTLCGIILSQSRSIWVGFITACVLTIFMYDRRKTIIYLIAILTIAVVISSFNSDLKRRAFSIVTTIFTDSAVQSTGNRIELWKGALLIFSEHPLFGDGLGDFQMDINKLIVDKRVQDVPFKEHAHNIYLQALASRGLIGFVILVMLLFSMMRWGITRINKGKDSDIGGYVIAVTTILTAISGLTDNHIEFTMFLATYSLIIGLVGPYGSGVTTKGLQNQFDLICEH